MLEKTYSSALCKRSCGFTLLLAFISAVDAVAAHGAEFRDKMHLLWFGVGTTESSFYTLTHEVRAQLEKAGIPSGYYESPGTAHEFQTWRRCLHEFAPLLFKATSSTRKH